MSQAPLAQKRTQVFATHGDRREDPYAWLKDEGWRQVLRDPSLLKPEIRSYLEEENRYTEEGMAHTLKLQEELFAEMRGRIKEEDESVPLRDGEYAYYTRFRKGAEYPLFCRRRQGKNQEEEILLDGDHEAKGHSFFRIGAYEHSPDHRFLAYAVDIKGSEFFTIRVKDLKTGSVLFPEIPNAGVDLVWANNSTILFYVWKDENGRFKKVFRHEVGSGTKDILVYEELDDSFELGIDITESRKFITVSSYELDQSEVRLIDADEPMKEAVLVEPCSPGIIYSVSHYFHELLNFNELLILTNADALNFKIARTPLSTPGRKHWRDFVPHHPGRHILETVLFKDFIVRLERENALHRIVVTDMHNLTEHGIAFPEEAYELRLLPGYEFSTDILRFSYSSPGTPTQVFDYDMRARTRMLRKEQEIPSGHNPKNYVTRRIYATSHDGKKIPITLFYRKGLKQKGTNPLFLDGYGAYGSPMPSKFSLSRLSLVNRGIISAWAHVRGGSDCGRGWYHDGKILAKKNTFLDFIACAEHLVREGYTATDRMVAYGGSAGGMLVGVVANTRPDLFHGVVADVPFVDVLTTMCDVSLPSTPLEWSEWGNPVLDPKVYGYMKSYSPYDNVKAQSYPHMLVTGGLTDSRVTYWEPVKLVAKLRAHATSSNRLFLKTDMKAGHLGAMGRYHSFKEVAFLHAFVLDILKS